MLPLLDDLREIELRARLVEGGDRGDEIGLRLHHLRAVDLEQRIAALDVVADLGDQPDDAAGERRQHDRAGVLVEGDLADRGLLHAERIEFRP